MYEKICGNVGYLREAISDIDHRTLLWIVVPFVDDDKTVEIPLFFDTMEVTKDYERLLIKMTPLKRETLEATLEAH